MSVKPSGFEVHDVWTADGFRLRLFRAPRPRELKGRPVLLLPGANSNHHTFGPNKSVSLPTTLQAHGRDVFLIDFRGCRSSRAPTERLAPINLDRKIAMDLPAAVAAVREISGAQTIDLVGHSLGGVFIYLYLGSATDVPIGRAVTLCAPAHFRRFFGRAAPLMAGPARWLAPLARRLPGLGIDRLLKMPGPIPHAIALRRHFRRDTSSSRERRGYFSHAVEDLPGGDLAQLMRWVGEGDLSRTDGASYETAFARVTQPVLVIASAQDRIAPLAAVREAYTRVGSQEKKLLVLGRRFGSRSDYAHQDLLLAPQAVEDVFTPIADWLDRTSRQH